MHTQIYISSYKQTNCGYMWACYFKKLYYDVCEPYYLTRTPVV